MAKNLLTAYPGKVGPSTPQYPYGEPRDVITNGDGTGTPWQAELIKDIYGLLQAILTEAGITPSNTADNATNSQYLEGLKVITSNKVTTEDLINNPTNFPVSFIIYTSGFSVAGDGGGAKWVQNGVVAQTPSQSPSLLADALLNDANGNQWELVDKDIIYIEQMSGVFTFAGATAGANAKPKVLTWTAGDVNLESGFNLRLYSSTHLKGPGQDRSTLFPHPTHPAYVHLIREAESSPDGERIPLDIKVSDFTIDGSTWTLYNPWLTNSAGVPITDPEADYLPGGIIGDGGDIFDVVAADRRNPDYDLYFSAINLKKVRNPEVRDVTFKNMSGITIWDRGCQNMLVTKCTFENQGRVDDISSGVWTQSFGTPGQGQSFYMPSENHVTEYCTFDCNRSAITMNAARGGAFRYNTVERTGESAVFSGSQANFDGGRIDIHNNSFGTSTITDIISSHVETNGNDNYHIYDNYFIGCDSHSVHSVGGKNVTIKNNEFINNVEAGVTYPYGPFSERYAFNIGQPPVAGNLLSNTGIIETGNFTNSGAEGHNYEYNSFIDDRPTCPAESVLYLTKGGSELSKYIFFKNNNCLQIADPYIKEIESFATDVMEPEMSIFFGNTGLTSETAVIVQEQFAIGQTGGYTINIGFKPSRIEVFAANNNAADQTGWVGSVSWGRTRQDLGLRVGLRVGTSTNDTVRIEASGGVTTFLMEFSSWNMKGASFSVSTSTKLTNVRFVCYP